MAAQGTTFRTFLSQGRKALLPSGDAISTILIIDMLAHNWHLGLTAFGGPTVHFQIFRDLFVEKYHWLDHACYDELFALSQALPGPASTKMLYNINAMHYGVPIGVAAFLVWSLPMALVSFGLAVGISNVGETLPPLAYALLSGLNAATVGIIALAAVQLSRNANTDTVTRVLVFLGATAGMLYNALWYFPILMVLGGLTTVVWDLRLLQSISRRLQRQPIVPDEASRADCTNVGNVLYRQATTSTTARSLHLQSEASLHQSEDPLTATTIAAPVSPRRKGWMAGLLIVVFFFLTFLVTMICRGVLHNRNRGFDIFANLYLAGTIIFGGGPVVIPLLREYTVTPGWISPRDFLLGLAITQAFPGPNFNFAVYLGALAIHTNGAAGPPPIVGAMIAFVAIFTPGLWLQTGFWGLWSSIRKAQAVRSCLRGVHASAVGLVFTAVYRLFEIGYLDAQVKNGASLGRDPWWVVIVATSFVGGMHFSIPPWACIVLGAVMGMIWYGVVTG